MTAGSGPTRGRRLRRKTVRQDAQLEGLAFQVFNQASVDALTEAEALLEHVERMPVPKAPDARTP